MQFHVEKKGHFFNDDKMSRNPIFQKGETRVTPGEPRLAWHASRLQTVHLLRT